VLAEFKGLVTGAPHDDLYIDSDDAHGGHWFVREATIVSRQTAFQTVEILEFSHFGRALMIDNALQSAERDEYIYHEALVQPALCLHAEPRRVLIIGGGEGATAREVLKHPTVVDVVMVDIDRELVALAREHLSAWHRNCFDDARLSVVFGDGYDYVARTTGKFDVIIVDLVDIDEDGPAEALYTVDFYRILKCRLANRGIVAVQAMQCDAGGCDVHRRVRDQLQTIFIHARSYVGFVPSFHSMWGFVLASDAIDGCATEARAIDRIVDSRGLAQQLRFYDGRTHLGLFALTKDLRRLLDVP
jgi:spermidine synthase